MTVDQFIEKWAPKTIFHRLLTSFQSDRVEMRADLEEMLMAAKAEEGERICQK